MGGQKINARLTFTIIVQLVILVGIGLTAYVGMNRLNNNVSNFNQSLTTQADLVRLGEILRNDVLSLVNSVARGTSNWEQGTTLLPAAKAQFEKSWQELLSTLSASQQERLQSAYQAGLASINDAFTELEDLFAGRDRARLNLFVSNDLDALLNPFFKALQTNIAENKALSEQNLETAQNTSNTFAVLIAVIGLLGIAISFSLGSATYHAIVNPINQITATVQQVAQATMLREPA